MDVVAYFTQPPDPLSDGKKDAVISSDTVDHLFFEAEFNNLTADIVELVLDDKPPKITEEPVNPVEVTDILPDILDKITGLTAAVAVPVNQTNIPDFWEQAGENPETMSNFFPTRKLETRNSLVKPVIVVDNQIDMVGDRKRTFIQLGVEAEETRDYNNPRLAKGPSDVEIFSLRRGEGASGFSDVDNRSMKVSAELPGKGQLSRFLEAGSSAPIAPPQNGTDVEAKQTVGERLKSLPSELLRQTAVVEIVNKPILMPVVESQVLAPEPLVLGAPTVRVDGRPAQFNPITLFRQITETVVTIRDEMVEIRLSPEELGRVRVVLTGQDRTPHLTVWVDRPEILEQMRRQGDSLLQQLREQGMSASLDFRDGRQARGGSEQKLALIQRQNNHATNPEPINTVGMSELSRITPLFSGRQGINIRV